MSVTEMAESPNCWPLKRVTWGGDEKGKGRDMKGQCPKAQGHLREHGEQVQGFRKVWGISPIAT